jgi:hypothetical protein
LTPWKFPSVLWQSVEGVSRGDNTFIRGVDNIKEVMVPHSFEALRGIIHQRPIYIKFDDGSQQSYLIFEEKWSVLRSIVESMKDAKGDAKNLKYVVRRPDGSLISNFVRQDMVEVKTDYWDNEILRAKFYAGDSPFNVLGMDSNILEIDYKDSGGDVIERFLIAEPEVQIPTVLTSFDKELNPTLIKDVEIRIDEWEMGVVGKFRVKNDEGKFVDPDNYLFALIGDHRGGIPNLYESDISSATKRFEKMEELGAKGIKDVVIDKLSMGDGSKTLNVKDTVGGKVIRRITITEFDKNLSPRGVALEDDEGEKKIFKFGEDDEAMAIRFRIPSEKELDELEDYYKDIAKQMEGKAKMKAAEMDKWRKADPIQDRVFKDVQKKFKLVNDGISGMTMINTDKLAKDGKIEIRGVS